MDSVIDKIYTKGSENPIHFKQKVTYYRKGPDPRAEYTKIV